MAQGKHGAELQVREVMASNDTVETTMQLVTREQIAAVMALMPAPQSYAELDEQVADGLPKAALKAGVARMGRNADERREILHRVVPEATL